MSRDARALVLDFGGVVTRTLFETHDLTEQVLDLAPGTLTWRGPFDTATDPLWRAMQADEISERDYWRRRTAEVAGLTGRPFTEMADFVKAARGADPDAVMRPEALAAIETARQGGCKLAILSNELDLFYGAEFREKLGFLKDFDVIVDATYTKILKPDPRAYQLCLDELGLPAGSCVFVDDQERNIRGAEAVGMPAVHFDVLNPRNSYDDALGLLGLPLLSQGELT
ncbi:HAD family hydrolase [Roseibium sediminicola]|uniref:HAD-IA family hydrolase n=1 Tax=Roseibium sediminicola TaxID=2933272 RepID=A0ABT0H016_9HYPH|nr:HAD-IA family hydrolase [Roseibium sp. CAU 1639]MCK7615035.1 HAD-IA family hydrolase [Roseibium sp. CAU 1639]